MDKIYELRKNNRVQRLVEKAAAPNDVLTPETKKLLAGEERIVEHHTKYKEIHGVDETVWLTESEHRKLHIRLRKGGKCNIPRHELNKIATSAFHRTAKYQNYRKHVERRLIFYTTVAPNIQLREQWGYNENSGNFYISTSFIANNSTLFSLFDDAGGREL